MGDPELPPEQLPEDQEGLEVQSVLSSLQSWPQGPESQQVYQPSEAQLGMPQYLAPNMGFPGGYQQPQFPEDAAAQLPLDASIMMQPGPSNFFQQLDSAYQDPHQGYPGPVGLYTAEDMHYGDASQGPYLQDDTTFQFVPGDMGFMPFNVDLPEPEPRELAVQNAKAYLLQTSINSHLSL